MSDSFDNFDIVILIIYYQSYNLYKLLLINKFVIDLTNELLKQSCIIIMTRFSIVKV